MPDNFGFLAGAKVVKVYESSIFPTLNAIRLEALDGKEYLLTTKNRIFVRIVEPFTPKKDEV